MDEDTESLPLKLPGDLLGKAEAAARDMGATVNDFIQAAIEEKLDAPASEKTNGKLPS
jgi:NRPS condensation-like uncharacterized protein